MDLQLTGKRVLITGASKGIGAACAETFLAEGCSVVLVARDAARLAAAAQVLARPTVSPPALRTCRLPLSETGSPQCIRTSTFSSTMPAPFRGRPSRFRPRHLGSSLALKVMGYIHLTQLYLRLMKERGEGSIVNIIGAAGRSPRYDYICGGTGNAALMAFTGAVGAKASEWGIRVFGINPSQTRTDRILTLSRSRAKATLGDEERWPELLTGLPFGRLIEPLEIARSAAFLASPACGYVGGTVLDIDGGQAFRG